MLIETLKTCAPFLAFPAARMRCGNPSERGGAVCPSYPGGHHGQICWWKRKAYLRQQKLMLAATWMKWV